MQTFEGYSLNICMITREFPPESGGIGYYVYNLSKKLIEKGHTVTVITRGTMGKNEQRVQDGIQVFNATFFPLYPFHMPVHGIFVNSILKSFESKFDLVHLHSPLTPIVRTRLPIIATVHTAMKVDSRYHEVIDPYSFSEKIQSMYFSPILESKLFKLSTLITTVSPSVAEELSEYGLNNENIEVVWNGVNEKLFCPTGKCSERYILYTGVLRARKGLFDLIKCASIVNKTIPNTKFLICGTGPLLQKLREQVYKLGLYDQVTFLGRIDRTNFIDVVQNATVQVVPSIYEGLPTVLLEAMACGLPIVATNIGGNRDLISSNKNGLLVSPRSPEELANAIMLLLHDELLRKRLGQNARETIVQRYTWDKITDNFISLYEGLLRK
jgi:glycosyltransferase involved in cell wall biosynthesis